MTFRKLNVLFVLCCFFLNLTAQQSATYTSDLVDYQKALTLYNNKQYQAAQSLFETLKDEAPNAIIESDCAYYIANCAVRLNQKNADDLIEDFVETYPTSTKRNTAFCADCFYSLRIYKKLLHYRWPGQNDH